jgi:hypoxanthine phosphoribosyltransferase
VIKLNINGLEVLFDNDEVISGIQNLAKEIDAFYFDSLTVNLIPVLTGAMQFAAYLLTELEKLSPGKWLPVPIFASAYLSDGVSKLPKVEYPESFENRIDNNSPTLVVDDLLDTGNTMTVIYKSLQERNLTDLKLAVLINRNITRSVTVFADFYSFDVDDESWIVGFGMDSSNKFRGLDSIYIKK